MKRFPKFIVTPQRKLHYLNLGKWLALHPQIKYRKLVVGFSIDTSTIPDCLVDEFLLMCTFDEGK